MQDLIIKRFKESADLKTAFAQKNCEKIIEVVHLISESLKSGNKIMLFGNGGSAADAQHIAAEFVNRLQKSKRDRPPIAALALTTDTSILTSISNDSDFSNVFSRQIRALGKKGDIAWGISTSGNSPNMIKAIKNAHDIGLKTLGLTGKGGGEMGTLVDYHLNVESNDIPRIQEVQITLSHIICELVEQELLFQD
ncbi:MAG: SIS domain-containing protein [Deltaproteobacteria bacterium]|jgi:D-sedoheptulose 7-phosphate isomerase|nr:SIS domain-containing protein [Deltaproteobacteria bacterium]